MTVFWEPCAGGVRVLRLLGDTPCPCRARRYSAVCPLWRSAPTALRKSSVRPGAQCTGTDAQITGNFVEECTCLQMRGSCTARHFTTAASCAGSRWGPGWNPWAAICSRTAASYWCSRCGPQGGRPHRAEKAAGGRQRRYHGRIGWCAAVLPRVFGVFGREHPLLYFQPQH